MKNSFPFDFATLYSYHWYHGFPLDGWNRENGSISDWTTHATITFRNTADLFGYFVHFESGGNKTDAVVRDRNGEDIVFAEWEWKDPSSVEINEPRKLSKACAEKDPQFCFLLTYVEKNRLVDVVSEICDEWPHRRQLILCAVTYHTGGYREFKDLVFFEISCGNHIEIRRQAALPWKREGTKWEL